jgi:hypothetical protein
MVAQFISWYASQFISEPTTIYLYQISSANARTFPHIHERKYPPILDLYSFNMRFRFLISLGVFLRSFGAATNIIPFNTIKPLEEAYPSPIYKTFQPTLYVSKHGCVSYPAVNEQGDIS